MQDEGSQLLAWLLAPRRGEMIADYCAGAGGKTLAAAMLMRGTGRIYAMDVSAKRLAALAPRAARAGITNVHTLVLGEDDARARRLAGKLDRVLVDAPCSGFGTLRRNPDLKWRHGPQAIAELSTKQRAILDAAARLVKPGGRLVYATCSILHEENDAVADAFQAVPPGIPSAFRGSGAGRAAHRARYRRASAALATFARHGRLFCRRFRARYVSWSAENLHTAEPSEVSTDRGIRVEWQSLQ